MNHHWLSFIYEVKTACEEQSVNMIFLLPLRQRSIEFMSLIISLPTVIYGSIGRCKYFLESADHFSFVNKKCGLKIIYECLLNWAVFLYCCSRITFV